MKRDLQIKDAREIIRHLAELPDIFEEQLRETEKLKPIIAKYSNYKNFFYL